MRHQWVQPTPPVRWEHCAVCGAIRRRDDRNPPCKGAAKVRTRTILGEREMVMLSAETLARTDAEHEARVTRLHDVITGQANELAALRAERDALRVELVEKGAMPWAVEAIRNERDALPDSARASASGPSVHTTVSTKE